MARIDPATAAAVSLSVGQTVGSYTFFLPSLGEVRKSSRDDSLVRGDVRLGQFAAGSLAIGIGVIMSQVTGNKMPTLVAILVSVLIAAIYEVAMSTEGLFE